jgi:hypothetical protein
MQYLVISDTHGDTAALRSILDEKAGAVEAVLHLGDNDWDLLRYAQAYDVQMIAVAGNCDDTSRSPRERTLTLGGKRVLMLHGNTQMFNVGFGRLVNRAREHNAEICLFGHTHRSAVFSEGPVFFMNPGSPSEPRDGNKPSYGLLTVCDTTGVVSGEIFFL